MLKVLNELCRFYWNHRRFDKSKLISDQIKSIDKRAYTQNQWDSEEVPEVNSLSEFCWTQLDEGDCLVEARQNQNFYLISLQGQLTSIVGVILIQDSGLSGPGYRQLGRTSRSRGQRSRWEGRGNGVRTAGGREEGRAGRVRTSRRS